MLKKLCFLSLPALLVLQLTYGQDANYWHSNYNPGGFFTPGAVLAHNKDSGVFFYNPALLGFETKNSTSLSGSVYQYSINRIKNGVGTGLNLSSSNANIVPLMVSGTVSLKGKPFAIAYGLIRNSISNYNVTQRKDAKFNVLDDSYSPGNEVYVGQYAAQNTISQTSGFINAGYRFSPKLAVGISFEGRVYDQTYNINFTSRAVINNNSTFPPATSTRETYQVNYSHIGLRIKGGLSYNEGRHHLGLTVSSPLLHIGGSATLYADMEIANLVFPGIDTVNFLANTRQTGLKPRVKLPLSIGVGYAYDYSKTGQLYFAAEYFAKLDPYNIVTPKDLPFIRTDTANLLKASSLIQLRSGNRSLVNFAAGMSFKFSDPVTGYLSFSSDFSYADSRLYDADNTGYVANSTNWNNWHLQFGANFRNRKFNLRPGLLLTYGRTNSYQQPVNFDNPNESNLLSGIPVNTNASHFSIGVMLSYIRNL